jgi:MFS transporter, ACS family, glucarate transporter
MDQQETAAREDSALTWSGAGEGALVAVEASPSNVRRSIILVGMSLAFLAYLDRACISEAAPFMMRDLHLNRVRMGYVFSAFGLTYAALELPAGWLCDRIGVRSVLTRVAVCWSVLTAATGMAWSYASLVGIRLLFGAGEAGCYPALAKAFSDWLPRSERAHAEGWKTAISRWGGAVAPPIVVGLYAFLSWRQVFVVFGFAGLVAGLIFFAVYRDDPRQHPKVNAAELAIIVSGRPALKTPSTRKTPWKAFLRSPSFWGLCVQWFCHYYGYYFYLTWLPIYLQQARGMSIQKSALLASLPMLTAGAGTLLSGYLIPPLSRAIGVARARRLVAYFAYVGAAALLLCFTRIGNPLLAMGMMSLSSFIGEFCAPITWITAMDLGGSAVGTLTGAMNGLGQLGASVAPAAIGLILTSTGNNWLLTFYVSAAIYTMGALCWAIIDPVTSIDTPSAA